MARYYATLIRILDSIEQRLLQVFPELGEAGVLVSDDDAPIEVPPGDFFAVLVPGDGSFPDEFFAGGGDETLMEYTDLTVTFYKLHQADRDDDMRHALLSAESGAYDIKRRLLKALARAADSTTPWEPTYQGQPLLANQLQPQRASRAALVESAESLTYIKFSVVYKLEFLWDLA